MYKRELKSLTLFLSSQSKPVPWNISFPEDISYPEAFGKNQPCIFESKPAMELFETLP